jgi:hypothetical protein
VRRTWAPVGHPPVLRHPFNWKRASMAAGLCFGVGGGGCSVFFHVQAGSYDTASLIEVLTQLRMFLGGRRRPCCGTGCLPTAARRWRRS